MNQIKKFLSSNATSIALVEFVLIIIFIVMAAVFVNNNIAGRTAFDYSQKTSTNPTLIPSITTSASQENPRCSEAIVSEFYNQSNMDTSRYTFSTSEQNYLLSNNSEQKFEISITNYNNNDKPCTINFKERVIRVIEKIDVKIDDIAYAILTYQKQGKTQHEIVLFDKELGNVYKANFPNIDNLETISSGKSTITEISLSAILPGSSSQNEILLYNINHRPFGCTDNEEYCKEMGIQMDLFNKDNREGYWIYDPAKKVHQKIYKQGDVW